MRRVEWGVVVALVTSAATALFAGGVVYGQVQAQEVRLTKVETKAEQLSDALSAQAVTIARIDANVSFLAIEARSASSRKGE